MKAARRVLAVCLSWALVVSEPAWSMGPFERNDPSVAAGMESYDKGDYEGALQKFEDARKELPKSAAVEFDRGNALFKLGRADEAKEAYHHVAELDQGELAAKDYYNLGDAWAKLGNEKEAIASFRRALTLDPKDEQARHNLEVMLRKLPPPKQQGPDGGSPDGGNNAQDGGRDGGRADGGKPSGQDGGSDGGADGGADAGADGGRGDGGQGDGGHGDGGSGKGEPKRGDGGESSPSERSDGGSDGGMGPDGGMEEPDRTLADGGMAQMGKMSKEEAERLLDSMKHDERNLQLWRFQPRKPKKPNDKDW